MATEKDWMSHTKLLMITHYQTLMSLQNNKLAQKHALSCKEMHDRKQTWMCLVVVVTSELQK